MKKNIGWLYNKSYYEKLKEEIANAATCCCNNSKHDHEEKLKGKVANGATLREQNRELKEMEADSSVIRQLKNERQKLCERPSSPYQQFSLRTYYPGLITGIGMQHQTTLKWTITEEEKTITIPELKLGMAFDHATGLPIIPGSSLKGVLRESFPISNQQGFCDSYDEKLKYIAGTIQNLIDIEKKYPECLNEFPSEFQEALWKIYKNENNISDELIKEEYKKCVEEKMQELERKLGNKPVSEEQENLYEQWDKWDEKLKQLDSSNVTIDMIKMFEDKMKNYFVSNRERRKGRTQTRDDVINKLDSKLSDLLNQTHEPNSNSISAECFQKASLLAKEIFEGQKEDGTLLPSYERDVFFDAFPVLSDKSSIRLFEIDTITHHTSPFEDPNPISFLKIRPRVSFSFLFKLHDGILSRRQKLLLFYKILCDKGVGAKTNVGYGKFKDESCKLIHQLYPIEEAE